MIGGRRKLDRAIVTAVLFWIVGVAALVHAIARSSLAYAIESLVPLVAGTLLGMLWMGWFDGRVGPRIDRWLYRHRRPGSGEHFRN